MQILVCVLILATLFWVYLRTLPYSKRMSIAFVSIPSFVLTVVFYYTTTLYASTVRIYATYFSDTVSPFLEQTGLGSSILIMYMLFAQNIAPFIVLTIQTFYHTFITVFLEPSSLLYEVIVLSIMWVVLFGKTWVIKTKVYLLRASQNMRYLISRHAKPEKTPYGYTPGSTVEKQTVASHIRVFLTGMNMSGNAILVRTLIYIIAPWALLLACGVVYWVLNVAR